MSTVLLNSDAADHARRIGGWLARAETLRGEATNKMESAKVFFEQGRLAELTGDDVAAARYYRRAYAVFPHPHVDAGHALPILERREAR